MSASRSRADSAAANDELQRLVYAVSHDLGAPLRTIGSFADLLMEQYAERLDGEGRQWLGFVQHNAHRAQAMLDALLRYSRLAASDLVVETVDLEVVYRETLFLLAEPIRALNARFEATALPRLRGIRAQWAQLLHALIDNALRYRDARRTPELRIAFEHNDQGGVLSVEDNGPGVEASRYPQLSTVFSRLQAEAHPPGLGMGLAYCARIATRHGGQLDFARSPTGGLAVRCRIPAEILLAGAGTVG